MKNKYTFAISRKRKASNPLWAAFVLAVVFATSACQTAQSDRAERNMTPDAQVVLLPFLNRSETPLAGERAEAIALSVLRSNGMQGLQTYELATSENGLPILDDGKRLSDAKQNARANGVSHALTGSVEEWRYKSGLDGEPAVGLSLRLVDLESNEVLWSGSAARSGWSRSSLAGTAQKVLQELADDFLRN